METRVYENHWKLLLVWVYLDNHNIPAFSCLPYCLNLNLLFPWFAQDETNLSSSPCLESIKEGKHVTVAMVGIMLELTPSNRQSQILNHLVPFFMPWISACSFFTCFSNMFTVWLSFGQMSALIGLVWSLVWVAGWWIPEWKVSQALGWTLDNYSPTVKPVLDGLDGGGGGEEEERQEEPGWEDHAPRRIQLTPLEGSCYWILYGDMQVQAKYQAFYRVSRQIITCAK